MGLSGAIRHLDWPGGQTHKWPDSFSGKHGSPYLGLSGGTSMCLESINQGRPAWMCLTGMQPSEQGAAGRYRVKGAPKNLWSYTNVGLNPHSTALSLCKFLKASWASFSHSKAGIINAIVLGMGKIEWHAISHMEYPCAGIKSIHSFCWRRSRGFEGRWDHRSLDSALLLVPFQHLWHCAHAPLCVNSESHQELLNLAPHSLSTPANFCMFSFLSAFPSLFIFFLAPWKAVADTFFLMQTPLTWTCTRLRQCVLVPILVMFGSVLVFLTRVTHIETISSRNTFQPFLSLFWAA